MPTRARKRAYHHGDLRQALLDAALPLLRKGGPQALTLRAVARAVGVSQTAPYRHFADRSALVAAVAEDGFRRLHGQLMAAAAAPEKTLGKATQTARAGLQAIALAYVRFALAHPAEYRVMFGGDLPAAAKGSARQAVFEFLRGGITELQRQKLVGDGDTHSMALTAWALVHGLVMLALDGQLSGKQASPEQLTITATELLMFGMAR
ncbi:MAG TPA: TetR/AcrR family transcriptional regulator [Gemmatimonadaceae bacterium]|nr:TetR/AcrR family transcriptional regulator [Gemmatimonadaceae bacterium]